MSPSVEAEVQKKDCLALDPLRYGAGLLRKTGHGKTNAMQKGD